MVRCTNGSRGVPREGKPVIRFDDDDDDDDDDGDGDDDDDTVAKETRDCLKM
jgi:hypothetical protein